jgi:DNA primase
MSSDWVDFKTVKETTSIQQVLDRYGVHLRQVGRQELRGRCPLPTHTSQNSTDSFSVNVDLNAWCCQSASCMNARGGRAGGNVLDFVAIMERCSLREAAIRLRDGHGLRAGSQPKAHGSAQAESAEPNQPLGFVLRGIDCCHPYLSSRSIRSDTARTFGVGFYGGTGLLHGRVVIPIHNETRELVAYAGRATDGSEPKYRFPAGFRKSQVLFNLHRARQVGQQRVVIVEGFFDTMKIHQAGHRNVVGLMGSTMSERQAEILVAHFSQAVVMLDGDDAGRRGTVAIARRLSGRMRVEVVNLPDGAQPDQMASKEITQLLGGYCRERHALGR